jgi:transcriptional regulator with XRE-family HTH domain
MQQNWKAVAEALKLSRMAMGWSQEELAERAGTSRATIQNLEYGQERARISRKLRDVTTALEWPDGHLDRVLTGEVSGAPGQRSYAKVARNTDLPLAVDRALGVGDLLDTQVVELGTPDAQMIVVVRAAEGATPEQITRALEEWKRVQSRMIADESPDN